MRIAFFADIHANLPAFEAALADARTHGATHLICLGDIVGYGPQPVETLARVREVANAVLMGNHDAAACGIIDPELFNAFARETAERTALALDQEAKDWLRDLPYVLEDKKLACAHGGFDAPECFNYLETKADAARNFAAMPDVPLLVVGHTHIPCVFAMEQPEGTIRKLPPEDFTLKPRTRYVVNPGSIGFPRGDNLTADYLLFDTLTRRLVFRSLDYDLAPYRLALVRNGYNPMNYWFLSPSARQRQTELAFRPSAHAAEAPVGKREAFHVKRQTLWNQSRSFWVLTSIFLGLCLALLLTLLLLWNGSAPVPPPSALTKTTEVAEATSKTTFSLPPLADWTYPKLDTLETAFLLDSGALKMRPYNGGEPMSMNILSPLLRLPEEVQRLRLSFETDGNSHRQLRYDVRIHFIRADGTSRKDALHTYKRPGAQSYRAKIPADSTAFRLEFSFVLPCALTLLQPEVRFN